MEIFDIVDENGMPTGRTVERTIAHRDGIRHRTAHIWIIRKRDGVYECLLQKRSLVKDSFPGRFDTSSAGHVHAGDEVVSSALRELEEELGIRAQREDLIPAGKFPVKVDQIFHGKPFHDREIAFVFIYERPVDERSLILQKDEVDEVRWFSLDDAYRGTIENEDWCCIPKGGIETVRNFLGV